MFRSLAMKEYRPDLFDQHVLKRAFYRTISQISPNVKLMPVGITFSDLSASSSVFFFPHAAVAKKKKTDMSRLARVHFRLSVYMHAHVDSPIEKKPVCFLLLFSDFQFFFSFSPDASNSYPILARPRQFGAKHIYGKIKAIGSSVSHL